MIAIDSSNFEACLAKIAAKGGRTAAQARRILQDVHDRGAELEQQGAADPFVQAAQELSDRVRREAAAARVDALANAKARANLLKGVADSGGIRAADQHLRDTMEQIESRWHGQAAEWTSQLDWQLRSKGVRKAAISGRIDRDISRELFALSQGKPLGGANGPAREIAAAIKPVIENARQRLNAAGAKIGNASDFVLSTNHDPDLVRAGGGKLRDPIEEQFARWRADAEAAFGTDKTYANVEPKEGETVEQARTRFWRSVWEGLSSGVHMSDGATLTKSGELGAGAADYVPRAFEGTHNLARKLSQGRVLFPKDADAWYDYARKYTGMKNIAEATMQTLNRSARSLALMERLGTNPAANLNLVMRRLEETYRGDLNGLEAFRNGIRGSVARLKPSLEAVMQQLDGRANMPGNSMRARLMAQRAATVRNVMTTEYLGGVGLTHAASGFATVPAEAFHHGVPRLKMLGNIVNTMVKGLGSAERQKMLGQLGAFGDGLTRDLRMISTPDATIPGKVSALAGTFVKYSGLPWFMDNFKNAVGETLANNLAENAGKTFGRLDPHLQQMLPKYGIDRGVWDLLRNVKDFTQADGRSYMTPPDALKVSRFDAEALMRARGELAPDVKGDAASAEIDKFIRGLSDKLYTYYGDSMRHAIVTPGVRQRAFLLGTSQPGTGAGEFRRFLSQFKFWPLAAMHQVVQREIYQSLSRGEATLNLGIVAAMSALGGYLRIVVNDVALGRPIPDPLDFSRDKDKNGEPTGLPHGVATMLAALGQGGGFGIYGDFLFGELNRNRFGGSLASTVGGPAATDAEKITSILDNWLNGKPDWPEAARFFVRHIPFANLVYIKGILDYALFYHLYEAASPGWWERTNRRLEREQGRTMMGYAPGRPIPYTPFGQGAR